MDRARFEKIVEDSIDRLPARFRRLLGNVAFVVEAEPPPGSGLLGLYEGRPLTRRSVSDIPALPDRITIFQGPHERLAGSLERLELMVAETVWHEVAHYFGMNEKQVRRAENERARRLYRARPRPG